MLRVQIKLSIYLLGHVLCKKERNTVFAKINSTVLLIKVSQVHKHVITKIELTINLNGVHANKYGPVNKYIHTLHAVL